MNKSNSSSKRNFVKVGLSAAGMLLMKDVISSPQKDTRPNPIQKIDFAPPYYAAIFRIQLAKGIDVPFTAMLTSMSGIAKGQPGYLGEDSVANADGYLIGICYWRTAKDVANWKQNTQHLAAQKLGKEKWFKHYELQIAKVERAYGGDLKESAPSTNK